ncbi:MAG: hypothetical protein R3F62_22975 [Planctomycetota bacterium]
MFGWFKPKQVVEEIEDPVFGPMDRQQGTTQFEADVQLPETGEFVTVWVHADARPSQRQRELFLEFRRRYLELRPALLAALRAYEPDFDGGFELGSISIPEDASTLRCAPHRVENGDMGYFIDCATGDWGQFRAWTSSSFSVSAASAVERAARAFLGRGPDYRAIVPPSNRQIQEPRRP